MMKRYVWAMQLCMLPLFAQSLPQSLQEQVSVLLRQSPAHNHRIYNVFGEKEVELKVSAILNHKALIHNTWYKQGDKIGGFIITHINAQEVALMDKKGNKKTLALQKRVFE